jgi:uncharacterized protein YjiS (DUF1127 family)
MEGLSPYSFQQDGMSPSENSGQGVAQLTGEEGLSLHRGGACLIEYEDKTMTYAPTQANRIGGSSRQSPFVAVLNAASRIVVELREARHGRRELTRLANYGDAMLGDIGITRSDIEWALKQPWYADPSLALDARVNRRNVSVLWARSFWAS